MHALSKEFDATELRQARASFETIDLRALEFGPDKLRSASTTSERVTHLHKRVPAITHGMLARTHELKMTIDLANILDRFLPLKTLEMAF